MTLCCVTNNANAEDSLQNREMKMKVAYLFHFAQFTEWSTQLTAFNYCVYENEETATILKQAYKDKKIGDLVINVATIYENSLIDSCQVIFFPQATSEHFFYKIDKKSILTVGVQKNFIQLGGIIYLFEEDEKIRFYINNKKALQVNLKLNSQLLSLSKEPPA